MRLLFLLQLFCTTSISFAFDHSHSEFDALLNEIVIEKGAETAVDYNQLNNNPASLDHYLSSLESVSKNTFDNWNKNQQLAFLINAYNAFTLKLIINNYPGIDSIRDLGGLIFSSPWDKKFFTLFGKKTSLGYIEHDVLREEYDEPRIHFAINCASKSCPALQKKVYVADKMNEQLENAAKQFMRNTKYNRFDPEKKLLEISSIFTWFTKDFTKSGSLQNYIAPYISDDPAIQALLLDDKTKSSSVGISNTLKQNAIKIIYLEYDWSLNKL